MTPSITLNLKIKERVVKMFLFIVASVLFIMGVMSFFVLNGQKDFYSDQSYVSEGEREVDRRRTYIGKYKQ
jgi:CHASE3 domain sensor protein